MIGGGGVQKTYTDNIKFPFKQNKIKLGLKAENEHFKTPNQRPDTSWSEEVMASCDVICSADEKKVGSVLVYVFWTPPPPINFVHDH